MLDSQIRAFAAANRGLIDRATALELGATDDAIAWQLSVGRWHRVHHGVYDLNVTAPSWEAEVQAAVLAAGDEALASHRSASRLWGLDGFATSIVELTVPFTDEPTPAGVVVHRTRRPLPKALVKGIPTTSIERTLLDLASLTPLATLEKACASAMRLRLTRPAEIAVALREFGGRGVRGTKKLRRVLGVVADDATGSAAEVEMIRLIRSAPIPQPVLQLEISLPDDRRAFPDFAWPRLMKLIEVDGHDTHSTPEQLHDDLVRQNLLLDLGWEVRRFSARRVHRHPNLVMDEVVRFISGVPRDDSVRV